MNEISKHPAGAIALAEPGFDKVLVVDDSRAQRRVLSVCLKRWGFNVTEAESGDAALALCQEEHFDLILSDWMMPGLTGPEFCTAFRTLPQARYGYFILVTSRSDKVDIVQGLECGADDFLSKPVSTAELKARIKAGARILRMEREMAAKTELVQETLARLQDLYSALDRDLQEARKLQQSLVPERSQTYGASRVALLLEPSGHVGGDLVGSFRANFSQIGLFAVDVSGHGVASALLTARIAGLLSGASPDRNVALMYAPDQTVQMRPPLEVCQMLNTLMHEEMETDLYFTMAIAAADLVTGEVRLAYAGCPGPLLQDRTGRVESLIADGMPIGLLPEAAFGSATVTLSPSERLLLYSDGMTECEDASGQQLEEAGLAKMLAASAGQDGSHTLDALSRALWVHNGTDEMADDVSALLFEFQRD